VYNHDELSRLKAILIFQRLIAGYAGRDEGID
jgi:hypothetical protein